MVCRSAKRVISIACSTGTPSPSILNCPVVEVWKPDGALDLQRVITFEEHRRRVRIDAASAGMRRRIRQKCENLVLYVGIVRHRFHAVDLGLEHGGTEDLSCPQFLKSIVRFRQRERRRLGPDPGLWD